MPKDSASTAEVRRTFAGKAYVIRYDRGDADWRERALAGLDPLSNEAFVIRGAPLTPAERERFERDAAQWQRDLDREERAPLARSCEREGCAVRRAAGLCRWGTAP